MKYLPIVCCIALAACGPNTSRTGEGLHEKADSATDQPTLVQVRPIQGYFVKNTVKQNDSITCWVINSHQQQDSILGVAKTMTNKIDTANFTNEVIAAVVLRPAELTQDIQLASSMIKDNEILLHFTVRVDTPKRSFTAAALWMAAIPKNPDIKTIKFYSGDRLLRSVPLTE